MRSRFLQLVLMPEDGGEVRSYRFPVRALKGAAIGLVAAFLLLAGSLGLHWKTFRDVRETRSLRAENTALAEKVALFQQTIAQLEDAVDWAGEAEREARLLAGLDPIDDDTRQLGIGGPKLQLEPPAEIKTAGLRNLLLDEGRRIDQLKRQVSFQRRSYSNVLEALRSQTDRLARTPTISPVRNGYSLTSRYGRRVDPFTGRMAHHNGIDFRAVAGTPVVATANGIVSFVGRNGDFGLCVELKHGDGVETVYCHLKSSALKAGESVERGQVIGQVGNTGRSTGSHLHYEVRVNDHPVDPKRYILTPSIIVD